MPVSGIFLPFFEKVVFYLYYSGKGIVELLWRIIYE